MYNPVYFGMVYYEFYIIKYIFYILNYILKNTF